MDKETKKYVKEREVYNRWKSNNKIYMAMLSFAGIGNLLFGNIKVAIMTFILISVLILDSRIDKLKWDLFENGVIKKIK